MDGKTWNEVNYGGSMERKLRKIILVCIFAWIVISSSMVCKAEQNYSVLGTTITIIPDDSVGLHRQINEAIRYATEEGNANKIYTIKIPKGTYPLDGTIHVYGNIKLDFTDVILNYGLTEGNMLMLGDSSINMSKSKMAGYGTLQNITVIGGTWNGNNQNTSSLIRMAHSKNITFEKCTFSGGGCAHQVEVAAIDGFTVKNCTFKEMKGNGTKEKQEALQFDIPCSKYVFDGVVLDGTPMKNVTVTGCTFKNVPRGLGTHSMLVGTYHENIKITNNTFTNVQGECIVALNYYNCVIEKNKILDSGAGILIQNFKPEVKAVYNTIYDSAVKATGNMRYNLKTTVKDNNIQIVSAKSKYADESVGIKVYGYDLLSNKKSTGIGSKDLIAKGNYYISNVSVLNNTITTCGHGIHFLDVRDSKISGNTITSASGNKASDSIFVEFASKSNTISNNVIKNSSRYGIFLQNSSMAKVIENNTITASTNYAIGLYNSSGVTDKISNNTITDSKSNAIFLNKKSYAKEISLNIIKNPKGKGIFVYDNSTVSGSIKNNTITGAKDQGININSTKDSFIISANTVKSCGSWPVLIKTPTSKTITVSNNKLTSKSQFSVVQVSGGKVVIKNNTLSNGKWAVCIAKGATGIIGNNTLSKNKTNVYMILGSKATGTSTKNSGKKVTGLSVKSKQAKAMNLSWKKVSKSKGYMIEYATMANFSDAKVVLVSKGTSKTIRGLKSKKTYYVRMCSTQIVNGVTVYSPYCSGKKIKIK